MSYSLVTKVLTLKWASKHHACFTLTLLTLFLSSCALMRPTEPTLLAPATLQQSIQLNQTLQSNYRDEQYQLVIAAKVTAQNLIMIGLSPEGQRLFTLNYDGITLHQNNLPAIAEKLNSERILHLFQLSYWPRKILQSTYGEDYQIIDKFNQRRLMHNGSEIITIDYANDNNHDINGNQETRLRGSITIIDHQQELEININTTDFITL